MRRDRGRAADDERRARLIDQNRIDLIDDGIMIATLDLLVTGGRHSVVPQVIESELAVSAVSDVLGVLLAASLRRFVVLNAANTEAEKVIQLAHPFGVAASEIVVHGYEMRAPSRQSI